MSLPRPSDVRMKGFAHRTTVDAATKWIDDRLPTLDRLPQETVSLAEAAGRVLAMSITSPLPVPAFCRSMMDGYALRADETYGATAYNPLTFRVIGTSLPGNPFSEQVGEKEAVQIMTGAPMPEGADAVLPVEETEVFDRRLVALAAVTPGKHVGKIGEDIAVGTTLWRAGRRLRPQDIGALSSIGIGHVPVVKQPRVHIVVAGNELLPPGSTPEGYKIVDANGPMLRALVARDGGQPFVTGPIADEPAKLREALAVPADVILMVGGSSVGIEDHAPRVLAEKGSLDIHGLAMRPSSPAGLGQYEKALVFLIPGNPVSALCAYDFFAGRAIRGLAGREREWPYRRIKATLASKVSSVIGRVDYARVLCDGVTAEPLAIGGASILSSTVQADGFIIIPSDCEGYPAGAEVELYLY